MSPFGFSGCQLSLVTNTSLMGREKRETGTSYSAWICLLCDVLYEKEVSVNVCVEVIVALGLGPEFILKSSFSPEQAGYSLL